MLVLRTMIVLEVHRVEYNRVLELVALEKLHLILILELIELGHFFEQFQELHGRLVVHLLDQSGVRGRRAEGDAQALEQLRERRAEHPLRRRRHVLRPMRRLEREPAQRPSMPPELVQDGDGRARDKRGL